MTEIDIVGQLSGQLGGIFGLGMVAGIVLMYGANMKIISPYVNRAHLAEMQAMRDRLAMLEQEVKALEKFRADYMEILEAHSGPTLHPKGRHRGE